MATAGHNVGLRAERGGGFRARVPALSRAVALLGPAIVLLPLVIAAVTVGGDAVGPDRAFAQYIEGHSSGLLDRVAAAVSQLGAGPVLYPVVATVSLRRWLRGLPPPHAASPLMLLAAGQILESLAFAPLRRPTVAGGGTTAPFSSGHAAAALLGWGLVAYELRSHTAWGRGRAGAAGIWTSLAGIAVGTGLTRLYLKEDWLSDVVAGWMAGLVLLSVAWALPRLDTAVEPPRSLARLRPPPRRDSHPLPGHRIADTRTGSVLLWVRQDRRAWWLTAVAALVPVLPVLLTAEDQRMKDLLVYRGAGGTAGSGENIYSFHTALAMPFTYPPFAGVLAEPLSRVPLGTLQTLWTLATVAALVAVARVAMRPVAERLGLPLTVAMMLVSSPVRSNIRFGQVGVFLVLLVTVDLFRRTRPGLGLGLAIALKLTPTVFLPWLVLMRSWRRLRSTLMFAVGCSALGLLLLWPSSSDYLSRALWDSSRFGLNDIPGNQSVRGMLLRTDLPASWAEGTWLLLSLLLVTAGTAGALRLERAGNRLAAVAVLASLSVAVSPISWVHHLVWLCLPIAALVAAGRARLAAGWFALLCLSPPTLGRLLLDDGGVVGVIGHLAVNLQGLTAVAAVLVLPAVVLESRQDRVAARLPVAAGPD